MISRSPANANPNGLASSAVCGTAGPVEPSPLTLNVSIVPLGAGSARWETTSVLPLGSNPICADTPRFPTTESWFSELTIGVRNPVLEKR